MAFWQMGWLLQEVGLMVLLSVTFRWLCNVWRWERARGAREHMSVLLRLRLQVDLVWVLAGRAEISGNSCSGLQWIKWLAEPEHVCSNAAVFQP